MKNKTKILSLRLTDIELKTIIERAENSGVNVSTFLKESALSDNGITLKTKQEVYQQLQIIKDAVTNRINSKTIVEGCDTIWQFLK